MNNQGKKLVKAGIALSLLTSTLLHATNGDHLIGIGAKARGMAGAGIALSQGAESALQNPALITSVKGTEISFGGTLFMPDVSTNAFGGMWMDSDADMNMIPEVSLAHNLGNGWYIGTGMWGTAGMGVDYTVGTATYMKTTLQLMQFAVPVAYKGENYSIAVAPIMQYGSLSIGSDMLMASPVGQSQDFGFGFSAGLTFDVSENFTIGAVYKSEIGMTYDNQIGVATGGFLSDDLEQPAEYGVGIAYTMNEHTIAVDYKTIKWGSAKGYEQFGWDDQDVLAIGYEYNRDNYAFRLGYNHASQPIDMNPMTNPFVAMNVMGFPATVETHYAVGGTYKFSDTFSLDLAFTYAPDHSETIMYTPVVVDHSQTGLSFQLTYDF